MNIKAKRRAAIIALLRFIESHGGGGRMFKRGDSYRWRNAEGQVAAIGWE